MLEELASLKINALRERLVDSNARSVFVNAHPKKSRVKLDLHSLSKLCLNLQNQAFLHHFLFNPSFEISPIPQLKTNERDYKKTVYLFRKNEAFKNEFNLDLRVWLSLTFDQVQSQKIPTNPNVYLGCISEPVEH